MKVTFKNDCHLYLTTLASKMLHQNKNLLCSVLVFTHGPKEFQANLSFVTLVSLGEVLFREWSAAHFPYLTLGFFLRHGFTISFVCSEQLEGLQRNLNPCPDTGFQDPLKKKSVKERKSKGEGRNEAHEKEN